MSHRSPDPSPTERPVRRVSTLAAVLAGLALGSTAAAQDAQPTRYGGEPYTPQPQDVGEERVDDFYPEAFYTPKFVDLAFSTESFELEYRSLTYRQDGFIGIGLIGNEDDDFALHARIARVGQVVGMPCRLGVGIAGYAAYFDEPDETAYAIGLTGLIEYDLMTTYPSMLIGEVTAAPDITTFDDGERLVDFRLRVKMEISDIAAAFIGYHGLRIETTRGRSIDKRLQIGVSLGF